MKREKFFSVFWSIVIAFCIAFGGASCLISAFSLPVEPQDLVFYGLGVAMLTSLLLQMKWGSWILTPLILLVGVILWFMGDLRDAVWMFLYQISTIYDKAYGWGVLRLPETLSIMAGDPTLALKAIVTILVWTAADAVIRRKPAIGTITLGLLPLFACMVVTDTTPSTGSLFWLFFGILLLVLTQTVRRKAPADGNRLTAIMLIPALLATCLLFWAVPLQGYTPPEAAPSWLEELFMRFSIGSGTGTGTGIPDDKTDLSKIGSKPDQHFVVMEVEAQRSGTYYLRGQSFDVYTGTSWEISENFKETDPYFPATGLPAVGLITIHLRMDTDKQYLPYYTPRLSQSRYGRYENTGGRTYSAQVYELGPNSKIIGAVVNDALVVQCLELPADTRTWAENFLGMIGVTAKQSVDKKVQIIGDYVERSAVYNKNTGKMPEGRTDFARWFLEEGETGYCVHFATAATILLRAAGIPARYVTGYLAEVGSKKTNVLANQSHAWVEYLDSQRGWTVLDPTPPEPEPLPTEVTTPPTTEQPTEATIPPTETTEIPTQFTGSTGPSQEGTLPHTAPTTDEKQEDSYDLTPLLRCLKALAYAMLAVAVILGQYALRLRWRHNKRRGSPNQQALAVWKEIVHFSKFYRKPLSEELIALAEKAKFSQHTLTPQEVRQFKNQLRELSNTLSEKPWYQRLFWKLVFAAE